MTFVDSTALAASQLNTHLRDNLIEQSVSKATAAGSYFVTQNKNSIGQRTMASAGVGTNESTTTGSYDDVATPGPAVTVTTGTLAIVMLAFRHSGFPAVGWMSFAVSGATSRDPSDGESCRQASGKATRVGAVILATGLTAGSNTFTAKYKAVGTETFGDRYLGVWPL
jgi:hypothetical protein